jgi:putative peptidoglycan lipid II flippase
MQLPLAIFAIALAQASLPELSGYVVNKQDREFSLSINFLLRSVFFLLLPAASGLAALSGPLTKVLLQRGAFGSYSTGITASALFYCSFGLLSYGAIKILVNGFYAMQDTKTPVKLAAVSLAANIAFSIAFMFKLKVGGLALAGSLAGALNAVMLFLVLKKKAGTFYEGMLFVSLLKITAASAMTGVVSYWVYSFSLKSMPPRGAFSIAALFLAICAAIAFYAIACYCFRVREFEELRSWISRKR